MPVRSEWLVLYGAVVALYLLVAWREWGTLSGSAERLPVWPSGALSLAFVLHGILLWQAIIGPDQFHFGFAYALSATLWLTVLIVWAESYYSASRGLLLLVLPLAALASGLPVIFPGSVLGPATASIVFRLHLVLAILAYSLLTIAAMQALLMATMDRRLHGDVTSQRTALARFLDRLPPLLAMETVLFRLITAGFVLLIGVWFWLSRRNGMQARGSSGLSLIELYEQQVAETRRTNVFLERIATSLEKREGSAGSRT